MLRLARPSDCPRLAEIFAPYVAGAITFTTVPPTAADFEKKLSEILPDYPFLVWESGGQVSAYAYASRHRALPAYRWCAEVSIYADQAAHGKGAGTALYTALLEILRRQGLVNVYAGITLPNAASVGIHEKFGFRRFSLFEKVGFKAGAWHDVGWWEKRFSENLKNPPQELILFAHFCKLQQPTLAKIFEDPALAPGSSSPGSGGNR